MSSTEGNSIKRHYAATPMGYRAIDVNEPTDESDLVKEHLKFAREGHLGPTATATSDQFTTVPPHINNGWHNDQIVINRPVRSSKSGSVVGSGTRLGQEAIGTHISIIGEQEFASAIEASFQTIEPKGLEQMRANLGTEGILVEEALKSTTS